MDSGVILMNEVLSRLLKWNPEWHVYIVCPEGTPIPKDRCTPIYNDYVSYNMFGRAGFDVHGLKDSVDINRYDFDTIFNNQPEVSHSLFTLLNNHPRVTYTIPIINYFHWFVNEDTYMGNAGENIKACNNLYSRQAIVGALAGQATMVNSKWEKEFILKDAYKYVDKKSADWLRDRMFVGHPGVNVDVCEKYRTDDKFDKFTILWNHRLSSYTGCAIFFEWMDKLWEEGIRDFQVIMTNVANRIFAHKRMTKSYEGDIPPYVTIYDHMPQAEYYKTLWKADCGVFMHIGWGAWSMASMENMACEKPIISVYDRAAPEMFGEEYPLYIGETPTDDDAFFRFRRKFLYLKDNHDEARKIGKSLKQRAENLFTWDITVRAWDSVIKEFGDFELTNEASTEKLKLLQKVKENGTLTKHECLKHFGGCMSWTRYRKYLLTHGVYDNYTAGDVVYHAEKPEGGFRPKQDEWEEVF
jgi:glycosyltransferase involved in cell wall biosynthesis